MCLLFGDYWHLHNSNKDDLCQNRYIVLPFVIWKKYINEKSYDLCTRSVAYATSRDIECSDTPNVQIYVQKGSNIKIWPYWNQHVWQKAEIKLEERVKKAFWKKETENQDLNKTSSELETSVRNLEQILEDGNDYQLYLCNNEAV